MIADKLYHAVLLLSEGGGLPEEITSLRHDLKKHLHSLVVFLKAGQYEEALTYIEQIYDSANGMKVPSPAETAWSTSWSTMPSSRPLPAAFL